VILREIRRGEVPDAGVAHHVMAVGSIIEGFHEAFVADREHIIGAVGEGDLELSQLVLVEVALQILVEIFQDCGLAILQVRTVGIVLHVHNVHTGNRLKPRIIRFVADRPGMVLGVDDTVVLDRILGVEEVLHLDFLDGLVGVGIDDESYTTGNHMELDVEVLAGTAALDELNFSPIEILTFAIGADPITKQMRREEVVCNLLVELAGVGIGSGIFATMATEVDGIDVELLFHWCYLFLLLDWFSALNRAKIEADS